MPRALVVSGSQGLSALCCAEGFAAVRRSEAVPKLAGAVVSATPMVASQRSGLGVWIRDEICGVLKVGVKGRLLPRRFTLAEVR